MTEAAEGAVDPGLPAATGREIFPHTRGGQVRLRSATTDDVADCRRLMLMRANGPVPSEDQFLSLVKRSFDGFFAVMASRTAEAGPDPAIGYCALTDLDVAGHVRFRGWWQPRQDEACREAALLSINYAFAMWPIRKVYMHVTELSQGDLDAVISGIAHLEAVLPGHEFFQGQLREVRIFAVYRDDWVRTMLPIVERLAARREQA